MLAASRSGYVLGGIVSSLKEHDEQRKIIQNNSAAENIIQRFFAYKTFGSNNAMKNIFLVIEEKKKDTKVL